MDLPTREEYKKEIFTETIMRSKPLYRCEKCGGSMRKDLTVVLTTYPAKYRYECDKCGDVEVW